jgi:hypothetical protein
MLCLFAGNELLAQESNIFGTWTMFEMSWTRDDVVNTTTEEQLNAGGQITEYTFNHGGNLLIISNMTGSGELETVEGAWILDSDQLICNFIINGREMEIIWDIEFKDDIILMKRTTPDGTMDVVNSYKRK